MNSLRPHLWISHDWAGAQSLGSQAHPLGSQAQPIRITVVTVVPPQKGLLQTEIFLSFISSPGGWSQDDPTGEEAG
jgi:hypothetical protein